MATGAQSFYSTPAFELFRRGLNTTTVKKFRGIDAFKAITEVGSDTALDCMNVLVPGWGGLSKFRLPVAISQAIVPAPGVGPSQFYDFQQATGTRQVVAAFGNNALYYFTWNAGGTALNAGILINQSAAGLDVAPWSMVESNNIMFMANGVQMVKWLGGPSGATNGFENWGIVQPTSQPTIGGAEGTVDLQSIQRAGGTVTIIIPIPTGPEPTPGMYLSVGDSIIIVNPSDASYNGTFTIATVVTPGQTYTYAQAGANSGPFVDTALLTVNTSSGVIPAVVTGSRTGGVATYSWAVPLPVPAALLNGVHVTISGFADATLNGTFAINNAVSLHSGTVSITVLQAGLPDSVGGATGTLSMGVTIVTSRTYEFSAVNPQTGHYSNVGLPITINGPLTNRLVYVNSNYVITDPQVGGVQFFATLDGGGDFFLDPSSTPLSGIVGFVDFVSDGDLDDAIQAPLINNPPPVGKYLAVGQSRVFIANIVGGPNFIAYSGYEQILLGRPEESFPPSNRLLLNIGAEEINGIGILPSGIVGFGATKRMYILRGNVEDITLNAPVQFSAFLQELPWDMGTLCHQSIKATPVGLIFWGTDRTVQLFNPGSTLTSTAASLQDISGPVYPILRQATAGQEQLAAAAYFNWLERDWYALTFAYNGSLTNNYTIFWALQQDGTIDIFPCSIAMDFMHTLSTSNLQRILACSFGGLIYNLPVSQDTVNGVAQFNVIPATNGNLGAYWRGGYFGNESPVRSKMWKRGLLVTDQRPDAFRVNTRLVNNREATFQNPKFIPSAVSSDGQWSITQRANRCSIEIIFPQKDVSANVLEMTVGNIPTSDRM